MLVGLDHRLNGLNTWVTDPDRRISVNILRPLIKSNVSEEIDGSCLIKTTRSSFCQDFSDTLFIPDTTFQTSQQIYQTQESRSLTDPTVHCEGAVPQLTLRCLFSAYGVQVVYSPCTVSVQRCIVTVHTTDQICMQKLQTTGTAFTADTSTGT